MKAIVSERESENVKIVKLKLEQHPQNIEKKKSKKDANCSSKRVEINQIDYPKCSERVARMSERVFSAIRFVAPPHGSSDAES